MSFPILSFEQANPQIAGLNAGLGFTQGLQNIYAKAQQNKYLPSNLEQALLQAQLANQKAQAQLPYAGPQAAADVYAKQQEGGLYGAEAGAQNANAALTRGETPGLIAQSQRNVFSDQDISQLYQLIQARKMGIFPPAQNTNAPGMQQAAQQPTPQVEPNNPMAMGRSMGGYSPLAQNLTQQLLPNSQPANSQEDLSTKMQQSILAKMAIHAAQNQNPYGALQAKTQAELQGHIIPQQYKEDIQEATQMRADAKNVENYADELSNNYDRSSFKGPGLGNINPTGPLAGLIERLGIHNFSPEQNTDTGSKGLAGTIVKLISNGAKVTNNELDNYASKMKPSRNMSPEAFHEQTDIVKTTAQRAEERIDFVNAAVAQGLTKSEYEPIWKKYNQQAFPYDFKTMTPHPEHLNQWPLFLAGKEFGTSNASSNIEKILAPDGKTIISGPSDKIEKFLKDHPDHKRIG